ncbi:hypothetical protein ACTP13_25100 [Paenibacillus peoriae]|uniref:hypothetical protein n=1 Tax=Paenibacillus peoriae TaxID=59893 RepID=UPI003F9709D6
MRVETSMLAKEHLEYIKLNTDPKLKELTFADNFYFYLTTVRGLLPDTARGIVEDFEADMQQQPE